MVGWRAGWSWSALAEVQAPFLLSGFEEFGLVLALKVGLRVFGS